MESERYEFSLHSSPATGCERGIGGFRKLARDGRNAFNLMSLPRDDSQSTMDERGQSQKSSGTNNAERAPPPHRSICQVTCCTATTIHKLENSERKTRD